MPTLRNDYKSNVNRTPDLSLPKTYEQPIYVSDNDITLSKPKTQVIGSVMYANTTRPITPKLIFDEIKLSIPEIIGRCGVDDGRYLELLKGVINNFTSDSGHKWNFLTVENTIHLLPGQREYELVNFDQMISVFFEPNTGLNPQNRKVEVMQVSKQQSDFLNGINYFMMIGGNIRLINTRLDSAVDSCGQCGKCNSCQMYTGPIKVHYHINPEPPNSMTENMMWFPKNPKALQYFKEKLKEDLYQIANAAPFVSVDTVSLMNNLIKWDSNEFAINNKNATDFRPFDFSKVHSSRL